MTIKIWLLVIFTMVAFAANSILCRLALLDAENSPAGFTVVRLTSGAAVLGLYILYKRKLNSIKFSVKNILNSVMLFAYALFFSLSYVQIGAGTGALLLFSSVQITMIFISIMRGQRLKKVEMLGFLIAAVGFIYLLWPGIHMPPPASAGLMCIAGVAWGIYSIMGKGNNDPITATARNFILTSPMLLPLFFFFSMNLNTRGAALAAISGALTSGLGYVLWYVVLPNLQTSTAAIVQLSVPVIAALGGIIVLGESLTFRFVAAASLILLGIVVKINSASRA